MLQPHRQPPSLRATTSRKPERCKRAVNKRITHFYDADGAEVATMDSRWVLIDTEKRVELRHPERNSQLLAKRTDESLVGVGICTSEMEIAMRRPVRHHGKREFHGHVR